MHLSFSQTANLSVAAFSLVTVLILSSACRADGPDRSTQIVEIFNSFCLSTPPNFSNIDRRATEAHYQVVVDRAIPMPNGCIMRQKNWLVPSSDGASTQLTIIDGINGELHVIVCGIYTPDISGASIEHALSLLPRLGSPTKHSQITGGSSTTWWFARVGEMPPSKNSQVMLAQDTPGMPGTSVNLIFKTKLTH